MPRPRVHDDALRRRLLERASELVAEGGTESVSLRELAGAVGTSTTAVYSLFGGRGQLLEAVVAEGFRRFEAHLRAVPRTDHPEVDLAALGRAYRASALDDPHFYRVMFSPTGASLKSAESAGTFELLVDAAQRCIDAGMFRTADAGGAAHTLWSLVHGLVLLELAGFVPGADADRAAAFDRALVDVWLGLAHS